MLSFLLVESNRNYHWNISKSRFDLKPSHKCKKYTLEWPFVKISERQKCLRKRGEKKTDSSSVSIVYLSPFDLYKELWLSGVYILFVLKKNREGWKGSMHIIVNYIRLTWFVCGQFENEKIVVSVYWDVRRDSKFPLSSLSWIIIIRLEHDIHLLIWQCTLSKCSFRSDWTSKVQPKF